MVIDAKTYYSNKHGLIQKIADISDNVVNDQLIKEGKKNKRTCGRVKKT